MQREIKFRCWDSREKKMWVPIIDQEWYPCAKHPITRLLIRMDGDLLDPIMQFTGLLDKNGKEIYERDILTGLWECYWMEIDAKFAFRRFNNMYAQFGKEFAADNEVIGNIYENPELCPKSRIV